MVYDSRYKQQLGNPEKIREKYDMILHGCCGGSTFKRKFIFTGYFMLDLQYIRKNGYEEEF